MRIYIYNPDTSVGWWETGVDEQRIEWLRSQDLQVSVVQQTAHDLIKKGEVPVETPVQDMPSEVFGGLPVPYGGTKPEISMLPITPIIIFLVIAFVVLMLLKSD